MTEVINKHPFVTLSVKLPKDKWRKIRCLIDTGFSGGIVLPLPLLNTKVREKK